MKTTRTGNLVVTEEEWQRRYCEGLEVGRIRAEQVADRNTSKQALQAKQMDQAIALMKEAASMMSKIGYMVGKINQDNSR